MEYREPMTKPLYIALILNTLVFFTSLLIAWNQRFLKFLWLQYEGHKYKNPAYKESWPKFRVWVWKKLFGGNLKDFYFLFFQEERDAWILSKKSNNG